MPDDTTKKPMAVWDYVKDFKEPMDPSVRFSLERTMMSMERTLMSWVRTATSLITFGFTLYKFFEFELSKASEAPRHQYVGPRGFAMIMIGSGLLGLALATLQNWQFRSQMRAAGIRAPKSFTTLMAAVVTTLGILALFAAIFRW